MNHDLKTSPEDFAAHRSGALAFTVRLNDRNYAIGDLLCLREFKIDGGGKYTGEFEMRSVTYIKPGDPRDMILSPRYVIMSLSPIGNAASGARGHSKGAGEL